MQQLSEEDLIRLTHLCRIECTEANRKKLADNITKVLSHVETLQELDTTDVPPCNHVMESLSNIMRKDIEGPILPRKQFLDNSPSHTGGMIRVPPVMKDSN